MKKLFNNKEHTKRSPLPRIFKVIAWLTHIISQNTIRI